MNINEEKSVAQPMGHLAIHETVGKILGKKKRGKVLDIPAGQGALAERLTEDSFEVFCADLYPEIFKVPDIKVEYADLDRKLPFESDFFDYIVCVEGLEHIENPANAIREFSRLLKSGGTLVVSVPNIMNIEERLKWLFNGYTSHFKPLSSKALEVIESEFGGMEEIALHVNPIGYSEVRYLLERNDFRLDSAHRDKHKKNSWAFLPLVWIVRLISGLSSKEKKKERWVAELNSDEVLLGGNTLIFEATKL